MEDKSTLGTVYKILASKLSYDKKIKEIKKQIQALQKDYVKDLQLDIDVSVETEEEETLEAATKTLEQIRKNLNLKK